ncbi:DUF4397 domain-containing protein [Haladaptatus caseinilyticus]|uniref:DUF4397 domain-containing protein n=1 Tax=Haladaptatus caseinilyticus TaxID=2993314 RepID=UPI00224B97A3|nr:DUF4397 domain-containing protein [Haladaptatus caseinilyticus]
MEQTRRRVLRAIGASGLAVFAGVSGAQQTTTTGGGGGSERAVGIRAIHAIPGGPNVDVFIDGDPVLQDVAFKDVSDYLEVQPGEYTVQVTPTGQGQGTALLEEQVTLEAPLDYTFAAAGTPDNPESFVFEDRNEIPSGNRVSVRAVHLSPDAPAVDIAADGDLLVEGLEFGNASQYVDLPAGSYTIEVRPAGENQAVASTDVTLDGGTVISMFAVGLLQTNNDAEALDLVTAVDSGGEGTTTTQEGTGTETTGAGTTTTQSS